MPEITIEDSVKALDDKRLIKQILECYEVIMFNDRILAGEENVGYRNHPLMKYYRDKKSWLIEYGYECCKEYLWRFNRMHKYYDYFVGKFAQFKKQNTINDFYKICYIDKKTIYHAAYFWEYLRIPTVVHEAFREKLIDKWYKDKKDPKWTRRVPPDWALNGRG